MARLTRGARRLIGLVAHADAGLQFTSVRFTERLEEIDARRSIGTVADNVNAAAGSFFSTLEHELLSRRFGTRADARRTIARWIDEWYNARRRHSTCGMLSPINYELATTPVAEAA
jgi:transposase InsO family protein